MIKKNSFLFCSDFQNLNQLYEAVLLRAFSYLSK